ncbi:MAG: hypothetical protein Q4B01_01390 [Eubacteriales bacterium]|nr:hypothetical protein [Eubacteriales bacterium]
MKKFRYMTMLLFCAMLFFGMNAEAGFRRMPNGKYRYYVSEHRYISGVEGTDHRQWAFQKIRRTDEQGNKKIVTYCFDSDGYMMTGWHLLTTAKDHGTYYWYYFNWNGQMYANRTKNGHFLRKNGKMLTNGWHNGTYYGEDGAAVSGYNKKNKAGFRRTKKGMKYLKANGEYAKKEWLFIKRKGGVGHWYYFYSSGNMAKKAWVGSYYVDKRGWLKISKKRAFTSKDTEQDSDTDNLLKDDPDDLDMEDE